MGMSHTSEAAAALTPPTRIRKRRVLECLGGGRVLTRNPAKAIMMKVRSSLKSLKNRHRDCQVVRRRDKVYVINKTNPRFKARAG